MRTEMTKKWIWIIIFAPLGLALFVAIGGWVVMALWNWLLPTLFGWPEVTFWQALGILALSRILFGAFFILAFTNAVFNVANHNFNCECPIMLRTFFTYNYVRGIIQPVCLCIFQKLTLEILIN